MVSEGFMPDEGVKSFYTLKDPEAPECHCSSQVAQLEALSLRAGLLPQSY